MSYLELPDGTRMNVFGQGGGEQLAEMASAPFIGKIPMDPGVREGGDTGYPVVAGKPDSASGRALRDVAEKIAASISVAALSEGGGIPIKIVG
jgi:ATP-binding protein involved in chromosome partitioning